MQGERFMSDIKAKHEWSHDGMQICLEPVGALTPRRSANDVSMASSFRGFSRLQLIENKRKTLLHSFILAIDQKSRHRSLLLVSKARLSLCIAEKIDFEFRQESSWLTMLNSYSIIFFLYCRDFSPGWLWWWCHVEFGLSERFSVLKLAKINFV